HEDDPSAVALTSHRPRPRLREEERTAQVQADDALELLRPAVEEVAPEGEAGVGHDGIDATVLCHGPVDEAPRELHVRRVAGDSGAPAPFLADAGDRRLDPLTVDIVEHGRSAAQCQPTGDLQADPGPGTRYDRNW